MKKIILFVLTCITFFSINCAGQKIANAINSETYKAQAAIGGVTNTISAAANAVSTAKTLGSFLKGKKKHKKGDADSNTPTEQSAAADSTANVSVTRILFDKIEYMQMKNIKDELIKNRQIKDVEINYNTDGKNFLLIQHETDTDKILGTILNNWGNAYDVVSINDEAVVLKKK